MRLFDMPRFLDGFFDFLDDPMWRAWPFNSGYGENILPTIARLVFVIMIFVVILVFLRVMFGPNGYFRDEEMDREADEQRAEEMAALEEEFAKGTMSDMEFQIRKKSIQD